MKPSVRIWSSLFVVILASLACGPLPDFTPSEDTDSAIQTSVAATLTAGAGAGPVTPADATEAASPEPVEPTLPPPPAVLRAAYIKSNNVWVWTEGLGTVQLTASGDVQDLALSDDGQVVAFVRASGYFNLEIWAINTDGSGERLLVSSAELQATYSGAPADAPSGIGLYQMVWRPGSHSLYYSTRPLFEGPGSMGYYDLHYVNADSLEKVTLFEAGDGGVAFFSPDGLQIAMSVPTSISLVNFDGGNLRRDVLPFAQVITYSEYLYHPIPVWAPDSSQVRVVIPPADPLIEPVPPSTLWLIPTDGSAAVFSGGIPAIPFAWPDTAISPDLSRVAYAKSVGAPAANIRELHLANADGSGDTVFLSGESVEFIGWLPNSTQFLFVVRGSSPAAGTHMGTLGGGDTILAPDPTVIGDFSWPDETHYFSRWRVGGALELRYTLLGGASTLIDSGEIWTYDFSH